MPRRLRFLSLTPSLAGCGGGGLRGLHPQIRTGLRWPRVSLKGTSNVTVSSRESPRKSVGRALTPSSNHSSTTDDRARSRRREFGEAGSLRPTSPDIMLTSIQVGELSRRGRDRWPYSGARYSDHPRRQAGAAGDGDWQARPRGDSRQACQPWPTRMGGLNGPLPYAMPPWREIGFDLAGTSASGIAPRNRRLLVAAFHALGLLGDNAGCADDTKRMDG